MNKGLVNPYKVGSPLHRGRPSRYGRVNIPMFTARRLVRVRLAPAAVACLGVGVARGR
jgi:hypothetical protein